MEYLKKYLIAFLLFTLLIGFSYSNTLDVPWLLDDRPNIVYNIFLHLEQLSLENILNTFYTNPSNPYQLSEKIYRPVACLSFALNWYFGQDDVFGYHIVNLSLHFITSISLFFFILNLFQTPRLKKDAFILKYSFQKTAFLTAFWATLFWSVNPIQTQAVTYIVQRMASMAAMFYIMGMLFYLKGRLKPYSRSFFWYGCCFICFVLSIGSKQNGVMLPISLLLVEILFFQDLSNKQTLKKLLVFSLITALLLLFLSMFLFLNNNPLSILNYKNRTFSVIERLLVQPRVLTFHLSQIFFPSPERFSIAHDFVLSSSIFRPWTTIPSISFIIILIAIALYEAKKQPLFSFAVLFFFINHVIESTVLPLEIVFEHRNYLPSMFLFLPLVFWFTQLLNQYHSQKKTLRFLFGICLLITIAISFSVSTYLRNNVWKDDVVLWSDAYKKAPNDARAANILAIRLAWGDRSNHPNRYDMAIELLEKSLKMNMPSISVKAEIIGNMASVYSNNKKDYKQAIQLFKKALAINPQNLKIRSDMVRTLILMGNYEESLKNIKLLISKDDKNGIYYNLKGFILLWQGKYQEAFTDFQTALRLLPLKKSLVSNGVLLNIGVTLSLKKDFELAYEVLEELIKLEPDNLYAYFALIENSVRADDEIKAKKYAAQIMSLFSVDTIVNNISVLPDNRRFAPISKKLIEPFILDVIKKEQKY